MKSNFDFLNRYWPALAQIGATAETYVYSDPNACIYKLGMFAERLVQEILVFEHIAEPAVDNTHANRIRILKRAGLLPHEIDNTLYVLRKTRNAAVHIGTDSVEEAKTIAVPNKKIITLDYLCYYTNSPLGKKSVEIGKHGIALTHFNVKGYSQMSINIPTIPEQTIIVHTLGNLLAQEQHSKKVAEAVLDQIDLMKKSILARAFRGELDTNDPSEESAVELLRNSIN